MEKGEWVTSSFCGNGACVEVNDTGERIKIRTTFNPFAVVLSCTPDEWKAFTEGVKAGEFDIS